MRLTRSTLGVLLAFSACTAEAGEEPRTTPSRMATLGAARVARPDDRLGSIEERKLADLIVVDGDPDALCREVDIRPPEGGSR